MGGEQLEVFGEGEMKIHSYEPTYRKPEGWVVHVGCVTVTASEAEWVLETIAQRKCGKKTFDDGTAVSVEWGESIVDGNVVPNAKILQIGKELLKRGLIRPRKKGRK